MKKTIYSLLVLTLISFLFSCGSGDMPETPDPKPDKPIVETKIPINISMGEIGARATDASFETGDAVGLYVVNYNNATPGTLKTSGNHVDNMRFVYGTQWVPDDKIYWKDEVTHADFYAYYPYTTVGSVTAYPFSVQSNQSTETGYKQSDFLWGKASNVKPTESAVKITTNHVFSNVVVKLAAGSGFTADEITGSGATVKLINTVLQSKIDLTNGTATASGAQASIQMRNEGSQFRALVVPQAIPIDLALVVVSLGGQDYTLKTSTDMSFIANKQHTFTVTLNKKGSGIDIGIGEWETDDIDYGGAAQ